MRVCFFFGLLAVGAFAQSSAYLAPDWANLREDLRLLNQRVGELSLRVEQLERENATLQAKLSTGGASGVTQEQLHDALAEINRALKLALAASKAETLQHVAAQLEKLANQTNAALESVSRGGVVAKGPPVSAPAALPAPGSFSSDYPKEGISYTVVKGDTLAKIVQKTGAKREDIINANKLTDPSKLQVAQVLFIPGAK